MTECEIYGAMVLALLPSSKLVDVTDINPVGVTMEQLEALPVVEDEQLMEEAVRLQAVYLRQRWLELQMPLEKMAYMDYQETLELEEQQDGWHTCHEYSKCKRGSSSKPHKKAAYWNRVRSFCVRRNYH